MPSIRTRRPPVLRAWWCVLTLTGLVAVSPSLAVPDEGAPGVAAEVARARQPAERAHALAALVRMADGSPEHPCDLLARRVNLYAHVPTLAALARWRDVAFLE